ncbi:hypothetical protein C8Q77DRAFT_924946 [Trametes polyzona]|nr:hypothetical protein C8Q77DRAFT_924946 [Trametes polyzona]
MPSFDSSSRRRERSVDGWGCPASCEWVLFAREFSAICWGSLLGTPFPPGSCCRTTEEPPAHAACLSSVFVRQTGRSLSSFCTPLQSRASQPSMLQLTPVFRRIQSHGLSPGSLETRAASTHTLSPTAHSDSRPFCVRNVPLQAGGACQPKCRTISPRNACDYRHGRSMNGRPRSGPLDGLSGIAHHVLVFMTLFRTKSKLLIRRAVRTSRQRRPSVLVIREQGECRPR